MAGLVLGLGIQRLLERTGCSQKTTATQQEARATKKRAGVKEALPGRELHLPWDSPPLAHCRAGRRKQSGSARDPKQGGTLGLREQALLVGGRAADF